MPPAEVAPTDPARAADVPGRLLTSGASADLYAIDDDRVLRRYRDGRDVTPERLLLDHLAAHGFPAPRVDDAAGADLVMEWLHGPTMLQALGAGEMTLHDAGELLADLHLRLHDVPAPAGWRPTGAGDAAAGPVVVHLDLHPGTVVLTERGPFVVDWAHARPASAELDVAVSALIVAEVAVDAGGDYSQAARALLASFLHASDIDAVAALDEAAALRANDPQLVPGERELVQDAAALVRTLVSLTARR
ncbi:phosphotransferase [Cellulomonas shaoxiangyii]|uniref:Aminoglycoside phosphotransferase family protein n=1 Tax=Cellulomonas shaoxiangyii TaxID=2566013 RepID=A0A4P7SKA3_9CELL|nr:phosphotransferase [Cellulomonas shaoxiangyii]QCB94719.1 aminoglycoside phosphotransferase family protein [Cellulomonas shaoxiangyii]TGY86449.1 aminoglycoside phosphotransferase family protein [Cellulomonas shaoxiangyii]